MRFLKYINKSGRKGPYDDLIQLIVEMKNRNPRYGYLRIVIQIKEAFGMGDDCNGAIQSQNYWVFRSCR